MRDLIKGVLLYGSVNWRRASDGLHPPRLSPDQRKLATPMPRPDIVKPRQNPQPALAKVAPKKQPVTRDVTAGAIVSDPLADPEELMLAPRYLPVTSSMVEEADPPTTSADETIIVRRRKRHSRHGLSARRAPRSMVQYAVAARPGFFARLFGSR